MKVSETFRVTREDLQFHRRQLVLVKRNYRKMKKVNEIIRSNPKNQLTDEKRKQLSKMGFIPEKIEALFSPNIEGERGFYKYEINQSLKKVRRIKKFINHIEKNGVAV